MVFTESIQVDTNRELDVVNITGRIEEVVSESGITNGLVNVFVKGSTCAIVALEYEPGLIKDLGSILERIAPGEEDFDYLHQQRWNDYNGHSHIRSSILGCSITVPLVDNTLALGTWQQIVLVELDVRKRNREVIVTVVD
jgi:secondary thiamine-phosphate synthase enzyme